jgi:hypothetical protein
MVQPGTYSMGLMFIHNPIIQKLARVKVTAALALGGIFPQFHLSVPRAALH